MSLNVVPSIVWLDLGLTIQGVRSGGVGEEGNPLMRELFVKSGLSGPLLIHIVLSMILIWASINLPFEISLVMSAGIGMPRGIAAWTWIREPSPFHLSKKMRCD